MGGFASSFTSREMNNLHEFTSFPQLMKLTFGFQIDVIDHFPPGNEGVSDWRIGRTDEWKSGQTDEPTNLQKDKLTNEREWIDSQTNLPTNKHTVRKTHK